MTSPLHDLVVWLFATVGLVAVVVFALSAVVILGLFQAEGLILAPKSHLVSKTARKAKALKERNAAIASVLAREEARAAAKKKPPPRTSSKKRRANPQGEDSTRPMNKVCFELRRGKEGVTKGGVRSLKLGGWQSRGAMVLSVVFFFQIPPSLPIARNTRISHVSLTQTPAVMNTRLIKQEELDRYLLDLRFDRFNKQQSARKSWLPGMARSQTP